jgi:hypothetical protein
MEYKPAGYPPAQGVPKDIENNYSNVLTVTHDSNKRVT